MIIGIDGNEANVEKRVGIGEYAFELLSQFEKFKAKNIKFKIYLERKPLPHMPKERDGWEYLIFGPRLLWTQFALPLKLFTQPRKPDVFFSPTHYGPRFSPIPSAISIMDLSFIYYPEMFKQKDLRQLKSWTAYSAKKASLIFTISNSTKNDIIKEYKIASDRILVTYVGVKQKEDKNIVKNVKEKYGINSDFILFVGTIQPRKNLKKLIEAFSMLGKDNLSLAVVGKKGWQYEEIFDAPKAFGVEDKVKFLDFVSDEDLSTLYEEALCFVLPSLYEGFGLPILEAMKHGCPVITSDVSSMPEAGGDAAMYVDPKNAEDIKNKLEKVITDGNLRQEMKEKGYKQVNKFSWERTAKQTLEALENLASK